MTSLVEVAGVALPEPSTYSGLTATIVDSARNAEGRLIGAVVRDDVAKVELSWRFLTAAQWSNILKLFTISSGGGFTNSVRFFNQTTASYTTRQMYVSDRSAGMWRRDSDSGNVAGFTDCRLSLIEV